MAVIRIIKNKDYTVMSNVHLKDKRLSLKAIGLLSVVLSLPDSWQYTVNGLVGAVKDGKDSVESAIKELKKNGYLRVEKIYPNENSNRIQYQYTFFENPQEVDFQSLENQDIEKQEIESQPIENQDIEKQEIESQPIENPYAYKDTNKLNTNRLNTNRLNTNKESKHKYGEYQHVLLTDKEHTHLVELYGSSLDEHIKILDEYIETSGKSYKNHSLVLQKWVHDEWTKRNKNNPVKLDSKFYVQENNQSYEDVHKEMERVRREILGA